MLEWLGFGERWRKWILWCIFVVKFSVLINGLPIGCFGGSRGLWQEDPISPMLFVIVMETLSRMLSRAIDGGYIIGFGVGANVNSVSMMI